MLAPLNNNPLFSGVKQGERPKVRNRFAGHIPTSYQLIRLTTMCKATLGVIAVRFRSYSRKDIVATSTAIGFKVLAPGASVLLRSDIVVPSECYTERSGELGAPKGKGIDDLSASTARQIRAAKEELTRVLCAAVAADGQGTFNAAAIKELLKGCRAVNVQDLRDALEDGASAVARLVARGCAAIAPMKPISAYVAAYARRSKADNTRKAYETVAARWMELEKATSVPKDGAAATRLFVDMCHRKGVSGNTIGNYLLRTNIALKAAAKDGARVQDVDMEQAPATKYDCAPIALNEDEEATLTAFVASGDLTATQRRCIRAFLFATRLGLRFGDLSALTRRNVVSTEDGYELHYTQQKTAVRIEAPICNAFDVETVRERLGQDGDTLFGLPANCNYNAALRRIARRAGLTRKVETPDGYKPLCEVLGSHTARRTCVSHNLSRGVSREMTCAVTGHALNSKAFKRYVNLDKKALRAALSAADGQTDTDIDQTIKPSEK